MMAVLDAVKGRTVGYFVPNTPIPRIEFAAISSRLDQSDVAASSTFIDMDGCRGRN